MNLSELQPLAGVRVLSLAQQLPGPYTGMLLQELGAEVVLVEQITGGDPARAIPPFFESVNRGKRSVALDLKSPQGLDVFHRLAASSRVILEGFRPGVAQRLGIDFESVRSIRPDVIYCSISGYGQDVPERSVPGHDISYQARAAGVPPTVDLEESEGYPVADLSAAMFAALAISSSLHRQEAVYVDLSLTDSVLSWKIPQLATAWAFDGTPHSAGANPAYGLFRTRDGWISLSVMHEDHFWSALCGQFGLDDFGRLSVFERSARADELRGAITAEIAGRDTMDLVESLAAAGVPVGLVNTAQSVRADPLFRSRGIVVGAPGREVIRTPLSRGSDRPVAEAPALGADTSDVLLDLGYSSTEIDALVADGAAATAQLSV